MTPHGQLKELFFLNYRLIEGVSIHEKRIPAESDPPLVRGICNVRLDTLQLPPDP